MDFKSAAEIEEALGHLGELLEGPGGVSIGLLVCGGAALIVQGYVPRATHDVDVLTYFPLEVQDQRKLQRRTELPQEVRKMAAAVAADMGIDKQWLSIGPSSLVQLGLPDGLLDRAARHDYGKCLSVLFLDREDQIYLKLYSSLSREERHIQDLLALKPTDDEMKQAKEWVEDVARGGFLPADMETLIRELGYERILF